MTESAAAAAAASRRKDAGCRRPNHEHQHRRPESPYMRRQESSKRGPLVESAAAFKKPEKKTTSPKEHPHFVWILWGSFVLTINAGFINTITLHTSLAMPSAHVTGIVARASNFVAMGDAHHFLQQLISYLCFIVGACSGGMIINYETFYLGRVYGRALLMLAAIQGVALIVENNYNDSIVFVWLATYCCGLQNSLTSKYSGNAVRTTHLTGASTDMGIAVGHILKGRKEELWKVKMHGIAVVGFFIGGILGFVAFEKFAHAALLVNVCLTSACGIIHIFYVAFHERISPISVLESRSDIRIHKHRRQLTDPPPSSARALPRTTGRLRTSSLSASMQMRTSGIYHHQPPPPPMQQQQPPLQRPRRSSHPNPPRPLSLVESVTPAGVLPPSSTAAGAATRVVAMTAPTSMPPPPPPPATASVAAASSPPPRPMTPPMTVIPLDGSASSLLSGASLRRTTVDSSAVTDGAVVVARVDGADKDEHEEEDEGEGHSSCSSVCGLEVELTPEELGPPPMYAKEDTIALLAAQEEEVERARGGEAADDNQQDDEEDGSGEEGDEEEARARSPVLLFGRRNSPPLSPSRDGDAV